MTIKKDPNTCSHFAIGNCFADDEDKEGKPCSSVSIHRCKNIIQDGGKFYFVWDANGFAEKRYATKEAAQKEARRLAELNPDQMFFVLSCEEGYIQELESVRKISF